MQITHITPDTIILSTEVAEIFQQISQNEKKDDPERRSDLYGPYEAIWIEKTGKLPPEYFDKNDPEPWKLLSDEARRNILWQALSGCLDINNDWSLIYIQLAMDSSLTDDEFATELAKVNKQFLHTLDHRQYGSNYHHVMKHDVGHIDCPGCSATAALLMIDPNIRTYFENEIKKLKTLTKHERLEILRNQGLDKFLNMTVQNEAKGKIILPS